MPDAKFNAECEGMDDEAVDRFKEAVTEKLAGKIKIAARTTVAMGCLLYVLREVLGAKKGRAGEFGPLVTELGFSTTQAYRCIGAYTHFWNCPNLGRFCAEALKLLGASSVTDEARAAAMEGAARGEYVGITRVRELIEEHTESPVSVANDASHGDAVGLVRPRQLTDEFNGFTEEESYDTWRHSTLQGVVIVEPTANGMLDVQSALASALAASQGLSVGGDGSERDFASASDW